MTEAIEDWPWALRGVPPIETVTSGDGIYRLRFIRRFDGMIQFFTQELRRCETEGQEYWAWYSGPLSGIYPDVETARQDAGRLVLWLRDSN
jgi:hypothetical protein